MLTPSSQTCSGLNFSGLPRYDISSKNKKIEKHYEVHTLQNSYLSAVLTQRFLRLMGHFQGHLVLGVIEGRQNVDESTRIVLVPDVALPRNCWSLSRIMQVYNATQTMSMFEECR